MFKLLRFWCGTTFSFLRAASIQPLKTDPTKNRTLKTAPKRCVFKKRPIFGCFWGRFKGFTVFPLGSTCYQWRVEMISARLPTFFLQPLFLSRFLCPSELGIRAIYCKSSRTPVQFQAKSNPYFILFYLLGANQKEHT